MFINLLWSTHCHWKAGPPCITVWWGYHLRFPMSYQTRFLKKRKKKHFAKSYFFSLMTSLWVRHRGSYTDVASPELSWAGDWSKNAAIPIVNWAYSILCSRQPGFQSLICQVWVYKDERLQSVFSVLCRDYFPMVQNNISHDWCSNRSCDDTWANSDL